MNWKNIFCKIYGHKRGKRIPDTDVIECPRCKATWTHKIKKDKAAK